MTVVLFWHLEKFVDDATAQSRYQSSELNWSVLGQKDKIMDKVPMQCKIGCESMWRVIWMWNRKYSWTNIFVLDKERGCDWDCSHPFYVNVVSKFSSFPWLLDGDGVWPKLFYRGLRCCLWMTQKIQNPCWATDYRAAERQGSSDSNHYVSIVTSR